MRPALERARDYCNAITPDGPSVRTEINEIRRCLDAIVEHLEITGLERLHAQEQRWREELKREHDYNENCSCSECTCA